MMIEVVCVICKSSFHISVIKNEILVCSLFSPQAYWRSCAALLGQILETAFKDDFNVDLLSTLEVPGR